MRKGMMTMVKALDKMVEYLNEELDDDIVHMGYNTEFIRRPAIKAGVYVTLSHGGAKAVGVNFSAYVYSPLRDNGRGCIALAERVMLLLLKCKNPCVSNLNVGRVVYNSNSGAFRIEITGVAVSRNDGNIKVSAFNFSENDAANVTFPVGDIEIRTVNDVHPIMTFCSKAPVDVVKTAERYDVVLYNVGSAAAELLAENGSFSVLISDGESNVKYSKCSCKAVNGKNPLNGAVESVEIVSYGEATRGKNSGG